MRIMVGFLTSVIILGHVVLAIANHRTADEILKEIEAFKQPKSGREFQVSGPKRSDLILELYRVDPNNAKVPDLMVQRWLTLAQLDRIAESAAEVEETIATTKNKALKVEGYYAKVLFTLNANQTKPSAALPAIEDFIKAAPQDERGPNMLYTIVLDSRDPAKKSAVEDRIVKEFPKCRAAKAINGERYQAAAVGKPFDLEFTDAIKGTKVAMKDLKGKVVVIDFWATWCRPCVEEMPAMKRLYTEFKDQGVEFLGVSLDLPVDEGGLDKLKGFVAKNEIPWPQYYQGKGPESDFSQGWGVSTIPTLFVVDAEGKLFSANAYGKLEIIIPELLKKGKKADGAGGQ